MTRLLIALVLLLQSCAVLDEPVHEPYWVPGVYLPYAGEPDIRVVRDIKQFCTEGGNFVVGCWIVGTNIVYIKYGLTHTEYQCFYRHEVEAHMRHGYGHSKDAPVRDPCADFLFHKENNNVR